MLYWLYLIIFSLKILKDDEDEAPYDRTYRDKSDMIVPEPRYGNSLPKYGNKTKADTIQDENPWTRQNAKKANKAESEEEGEEEEEGRNPYSQAKLAQQRKLQKQKENQRNEDRKEPNQSNSDDPPSFSSYERQREKEKEKTSSSPGVKKPNNPFLSKSDEVRSPKNVPEKSTEQSMDDVLAKMKNKKQITTYGAREGTVYSR